MTKISFVIETLETGAREVGVIGHVVSGAGHRVIALPVPVGLPADIPVQLAEINRDLQHAGRVLERQRLWLGDRVKLARQADAPDVGAELTEPNALFSADPSVALPVKSSAPIPTPGDGPAKGKGAWQGSDKDARNKLDDIEDDSRGDEHRLDALDERHHDAPKPHVKTKAPDTPAVATPPVTTPAQEEFPDTGTPEDATQPSPDASADEPPADDSIPEPGAAGDGTEDPNGA